jgi:hypothetical protein
MFDCRLPRDNRRSIHCLSIKRQTQIQVDLAAAIARGATLPKRFSHRHLHDCYGSGQRQAWLAVARVVAAFASPSRQSNLALWSVLVTHYI